MFGNAQKSKIVQSLILASAGLVMVFVFDSNSSSTPPPHPHIFLCVPLCSSLAGSVRPQDSLALPHWEPVQSERVSASCDASASLVNNYTHITLPLPSLAAWKDAGFIPSRGNFFDKLFIGRIVSRNGTCLDSTTHQTSSLLTRLQGDAVMLSSPS